MADVPADLVSACYEIPQAAAGAYDRERLRSILVPGLDADGPIAGAELFRFDGGQFASIKLPYDPARYIALSGR